VSFIQGPLQKKTWELSQFSKEKLKQGTGLITGHCHLKEHTFKARTTKSALNNITLTVSLNPTDHHTILMGKIQKFANRYKSFGYTKD